jgi:hypothetical protein
MTLRTLGQASGTGDRAQLLAIGVVVAIVLGGATEVTMAPGYAQEPFWVFTGIALAAARRHLPTARIAGTRGVETPRVEKSDVKRNLTT